MLRRFAAAIAAGALAFGSAGAADLGATGAGATLLGSTVPLAAADESEPGSDVIVIAFQTNWNSVARECAETYGPEGVGYVQVSPPQETITGKQWWTSYQPVSYRLDSKLGTEAEFKAMIATCKAAGVGVIADAVINHMAGADRSGTGVAGSQFDGEGNFPEVPYTAANFHSCVDNVSNYRNASNVQNCRLSGLQDLDTSQEYVQNKLADYMSALLDMGVAGFRVDAVKHIAAADVAAIKARLAAKSGRAADSMFFEQEVIGNSAEAREIQPAQYLATGKVSEFNVNARLKQAFDNDINSASFGLGGIGASASWVPSDKAAVWVTNWDTERNGSALTYKDGAKYLLANAFLLAYGYGQPHVYSGYYFADADDGAPGATDNAVPDMTCPAGDESGDDVSGDAANAAESSGESGGESGAKRNVARNTESSGTWQCAQRWTAIRGMIGFHNAVAGSEVTDWAEYGENVVGFGRGAVADDSGDADGSDGAAAGDRAAAGKAGSGVGYLAINNSDESVTRTFATSLPAGVYCNVYATGDCSAAVSVRSDGTFEATLPAGSAVAIHVGAERSGSAGGVSGGASAGRRTDPADPDWFVSSAAAMVGAQPADHAQIVMDEEMVEAIDEANHSAGLSVLVLAGAILLVVAAGRVRKSFAKLE
ncbi:alpha-amylase [Bifidobacterium olomucense]|uniref:Alpha-amylase n=1 Tax=Bifidobacterium olomucense TaxID=2675324 RepID=A0A7Y0EY62_9BIFI|nr:alpha-amylase family protein [Bifidobacterium sp. DSM 109959]NMM98590.1 pullulanase [Bifidobacterium sp. DSM 109959]